MLANLFMALAMTFQFTITPAEPAWGHTVTFTVTKIPATVSMVCIGWETVSLEWPKRPQDDVTLGRVSCRVPGGTRYSIQDTFEPGQYVAVATLFEDKHVVGTVRYPFRVR